jgi:tRNA(Ile)-lysidine synthase
MTFTSDRLYRKLQEYPGVSRYWVAFSGGLDSHVLLHVLATLRGRLDTPVSAIHVDHGLQAQSSAWSDHCLAVCRSLGVPLKRFSLALKPEKGQSTEALAREARYGVMRDLVGEDEMLLTAHHQDDQAETLLIQLMRGSGPAGLAAMPGLSEFGAGHHGRPLLECTREELDRYAREHDLQWVEDGSNRDLLFDRNFIRHQVMPLLEQRWPGVRKTLARSARHCGEAQSLVDRLAHDGLEHVRNSEDGTLSVNRLKAIPTAEARAVLRAWIRSKGHTLPNTGRLEQVLSEVLTARADASPSVRWSGSEIRRYRDRLYLLKPAPPVAPGLVFEWKDKSRDLLLPEGCGSVRALEGVGGIQPELWRGARVEVRFRAQEGMRCRPAGRGVTLSLKKLFQESAIPPWRRPVLPLVYIDGELAAVGDLCICEPFSKTAGKGIVFKCLW